MDELSALAVSGPVSRYHKCRLWRGKFLEAGKVHDFSRMEIVDVTGESQPGLGHYYPVLIFSLACNGTLLQNSHVENRAESN